MAVLVLIDVQKEYITEGRPFCLETIAPSLENLRALQAHARKQGWKVVHMYHQQNSECFTYGSEFSQYIEGFEPLEGEKNFMKTDFSCFSSPEFTAMIDRNRNQEIIVAGYGATMCCLSTMIDAHHRGYDVLFVKDATCAKRTTHFGEQQLKDFVVDIAPAYATLVTTAEVLEKE